MSTYYVSAASGNNANAGTSEGAAWATLGKAMSGVAPGDQVWVKADGDYNETATITATGTITSPIIFEGYTSSTGDVGRATINGQSTRTNGIINATPAAAGVATYYVFKNFRITAHTGAGISVTALHILWKNCKFDTNSTNGATVRTGVFEECEFSDNTTHGMSCTTTGPVICVGCRFYRNGSNGANCAGINCLFFACEFFSTNTTAIDCGNAANIIVAIINCLIDGDSKDTVTGIAISAASFIPEIAVINNIIYDCTTGINGPSSGENKISRNNLVNSNTANYSTFSTILGEITSAPVFNNEAVNDYRPGTGSPLKNAGFDANQIEGF